MHPTNTPDQGNRRSRTKGPLDDEHVMAHNQSLLEAFHSAGLGALDELRLLGNGSIEGVIKGTPGVRVPIFCYQAPDSYHLVVESRWPGRISSDGFDALQIQLPKICTGGLRHEPSGDVLYVTALPLTDGFPSRQVLDQAIQSHRQALIQLYPDFVRLRSRCRRPGTPPRRQREAPQPARRRPWWRASYEPPPETSRRLG